MSRVFRCLYPRGSIFMQCSRVIFSSLVLSLLLPFSAYALEVKITPEIESVEYKDQHKAYKVQRIQDKNHTLTGGFSKTSRMCPPFCIQPIEVAPGVEIVGELELLAFVEAELEAGTGLLVDARTASWHGKGTIPGSINIPFTSFTKKADAATLGKALRSLGAKRKNTSDFIPALLDTISRLMPGDKKPSKWDFSEAKNLILWCNGMWCGQSPAAIKGLIAQGYPPEKIKYYRGGMQSWQMLGLTVITPDPSKVASNEF